MASYRSLVVSPSRANWQIYSFSQGGPDKEIWVYMVDGAATGDVFEMINGKRRKLESIRMVGEFLRDTDGDTMKPFFTLEIDY